MLEIIFELIVELILCEIAEWFSRFIRVFGFRRKSVQSRSARRERVTALRRKLALKRWLRQKTPRGPIPDLGIRCTKCDYLLTGLQDSRCPKCGTTIEMKTK